MSAPETFAITTIEDVVKAYATLPEERGELMLTELAHAVRLMAPIAEALVSPFEPIRWINDTMGVANINLRTESGETVVNAKLKMRREKPE